MAIGKYYEDIVEARRENGAAIVFEYQYPQENECQYPQENEYQYPQEHDRQYMQENAKPVTSGEPPKLTVRDRVALRIFVMKLQSDSDHVARELLSETAYWSLAHFEELARMSPAATARLAMILARGYHDESSEQEPFEPSFQAVTGRRREVVVEIRKRRIGVLSLRHPDFW
jgi:hypothetical protein